MELPLLENFNDFDYVNAWYEIATEVQKLKHSLGIEKENLVNRVRTTAIHTN